MLQIYNKKKNNSKRKFNKISINSNIFLSFFYLQPVLYRKSPTGNKSSWTLFILSTTKFLLYYYNPTIYLLNGNFEIA